jgi:hypothetical protein
VNHHHHYPFTAIITCLLLLPTLSATAAVVFTNLLDQQGKGVKAFNLSRVQVL